MKFEQKENNNTDNKIVISFLPAVRAMSFRLKERLPNSIDVNDLISVGLEELVKISKQYTYEPNDSFWEYAKKRIYGAMLDYLRSLDYISRSSRRLVNNIKTEINQYMDQNLNEPSDEYLSKKLKEPIEKIKEAKLVAIINTNMPLNEKIMGYNDKSIDEQIESEQLLESIKDFLYSLNELEQNVIILYYFEELDFKEISIKLGIEEKVIIELHKKLIKQIRKELTK